MRALFLRISDSIAYFGDRFKNKYCLADYDISKNINDVTLFAGLYNQIDYDILNNHKGRAIILFTGSDANNTFLLNKYKTFLNTNTVISISHDVQKRLSCCGVNSKVINIIPGKVEMDYKNRLTAKYVYFYGNGAAYGEEYLKEIQSKIKHTIIIAKSCKSFLNIKDIYEQCFIGLRLTPRDGLSNTVVEMGLMGRKVVYNTNPLPNALKWNTVDDIVNHINIEYENRHLDYNYLSKEVYDYIDKTDTWLYL